MKKTTQSPTSAAAVSLPALRELGYDLLEVTPLRCTTTLALPFVLTAGYFLFAACQEWSAAVFSVMALCFVTYGSSSHDLVHRTLQLPHRWNDFLLSLIELLSFRSGTAYRLSHLQHHRNLLHEDDIEGTAAHGTVLQSLLSGPLMQIRLWRWAWATHHSERPRLAGEAAGVVLLLALAAASAAWNNIFAIYAVLVIGGSWVFPWLTVYIPHDKNGQSELTKTVLFRGRLARYLAFDHLYHLEHHLYPSVPHHHWHALSLRLDPFFQRAGITDLYKINEPSGR